MKWPFIGGAVLAGTMVIVALYIDRLPPAPLPDRLTDSETLVENFERIVFRNDYRDVSSWEGLNKWARPIYLVVYSPSPRKHEALVAKHMIALRRLTGLTMELLSTPDGSENLPIHFIARAERLSIVQRYNPDNLLTMSVVIRAHCAAVYRPNRRGNIQKSYIFVRIDWDDYRMRSCLLEEMTQVLGLPADSELIRPSIFSRRDWIDELSINDKILVRTLYDDRVKPGMTSEEALPIAREIITNLVARVKVEGEDALTHPRYKLAP